MKRIPCRVVRSVPIAKGDSGLRNEGFSAARTGDGYAGNTSAEFETLNHTNDYAFQAEPIKGAFGESCVGLLLDCLA